MPNATTSRKIRISALLSRNIVREIRVASTDANVPQGHIIETALKNWLKQKLDQDTKDLAELNFIDLPTEQGWLKLQAKI